MPQGYEYLDCQEPLEYIRSRKDYHAAYITALTFLEQHSVTVGLNQLDREQWWNWAIWMVSKFQPTFRRLPPQIE